MSSGGSKSGHWMTHSPFNKYSGSAHWLHCLELGPLHLKQD